MDAVGSAFGAQKDGLGGKHITVLRRAGHSEPRLAKESFGKFRSRENALFPEEAFDRAFGLLESEKTRRQIAVGNVFRENRLEFGVGKEVHGASSQRTPAFSRTFFPLGEARHPRNFRTSASFSAPSTTAATISMGS